MSKKYKLLLLGAFSAALILTLFGHVEAGYALEAMAFGVITGTRATAGSVAIEADSRVIDMSDVIHLLDPNLAPLVSITMKLRKSVTVNPEFKWLEDDYLPTTDLIVGAVGATATTFTVTNITYFRVGDVLKILETGETMYLPSTAFDAGGSVLTPTRGVGSTSGTAIAGTSAQILIIGNANAEGTGTRTVKSTTKATVNQYTQIFKKPFQSTGTLMASELYGGDDWDFQTRKNGLEHKIDIERSFLFGNKEEITSGTSALRFCDGVIARISTNTTDVGGTLTSVILENFLSTLFRYGPASKVLFCSRRVASKINGIAAAVIRTIPASTSFPLALTEYVSTHGKVYLVTHNLLAGSEAAVGGDATETNHNAYAGWALGLDMDSIWYRYLAANGRSRDTHIRENIQTPDEDGRKDEYLSECAPMLVQEKNHGLLYEVRT